MLRISRAGVLRFGLRRFGRILRDDSGQDLVEYVLLTAAIGLVTLATWPSIETTIKTAYEKLDTDTQELWEPPSPGGGGS